MFQVERIFKALANRRRLTILHYLRDHDANVAEIAESLHFSYKATSKHLQRLAAVDLVHGDQRWRSVVYGLRPKRHTRPLLASVFTFARMVE